MVNIFVDGCCLKNGSKDSKSGIGIYCDDVKHKIEISKKIKSLYPNINKITNNISELLVIYETLLFIKEKNKLNPNIKYYIYSDSQYSINCITIWCKKWNKNGWKSSNGSLVKNKNIIQKIIILLEYLDNVEFFHIKSHQKSLDPLVVGNNKADELANIGANLPNDTKFLIVYDKDNF